MFVRLENLCKLIPNVREIVNCGTDNKELLPHKMVIQPSSYLSAKDTYREVVAQLQNCVYNNQHE